MKITPTKPNLLSFQASSMAPPRKAKEKEKVGEGSSNPTLDFDTEIIEPSLKFRRLIFNFRNPPLTPLKYGNLVSLLTLSFYFHGLLNFKGISKILLVIMVMFTQTLLNIFMWSWRLQMILVCLLLLNKKKFC